MSRPEDALAELILDMLAPDERRRVGAAVEA